MALEFARDSLEEVSDRFLEFRVFFFSENGCPTKVRKPLVYTGCGIKTRNNF